MCESQPPNPTRLDCRVWLIAACWLAAVCGFLPRAVVAETGGPAGQDVSVVVTADFGDEALADTLRGWVGQPAGSRARDRRFWLRDLPETLQLALQSAGWYGGLVEVTETGNTVQIHAHSAVSIRLQEVAVAIPGARTLAPELVAWLDEATPPLGQRLDHAGYESLREGLLSQAISLGFLDAQYTRQRLLVSVQSQAASIDLSLALGDAYRVGDITFEDSPIRPDIVRNLAPFKSGDRYTAAALSEYARRLRDSGFFASARVVPAFDRIADGAVPLEVTLLPRKPNRLRLGAGISSDVGPRLLAGWDRYVIDERGHSVALDTELSAYRRSANVEYRAPESKRPATRSWLYSAGSLRETIDDTATTQQNVRVARERRHGNGWVDTTYLRYQRDRGLPSDSSVEFQAFMAGIDVQHTAVLSLGPAHDVALGSSVQWLGANEDIGADFSFTRAYARVSAHLPLNAVHSLRSRLEWGQLWRANIDNMPMSLRFFAGGDSSIRGFAPREASPQNDDGDATGGDQLSVTSIEYEYRFKPSWGLAFFVDRGRAWVSESAPARTGAGLGARWYSPIGPVNLDVARPVDDGDGDWRVHLTIGI